MWLYLSQHDLYSLSATFVQNVRLGLGTRLRLPLLVNTIASDKPYKSTTDQLTEIGG